MEKVSVLQEVRTILNVSEPQKRVSKYLREKMTERQKEIDKSTIIIEDINIPLSLTDKSRRQKLSKDTVELNSTINQLDLMNIY